MHFPLRHNRLRERESCPPLAQSAPIDLTLAEWNLEPRPSGTSINERIVLFTLFCFVAIAGYRLFYSVNPSSYLDVNHVNNLLKIRLLGFAWLPLSVLFLLLMRRRPSAPAFAVLLASAYFVGMYGLLYQGTEYGANGHWGDNGNRLAEICKMMAYGSFFQDWYLKDLPSYYPPGWFALMAVYAKVLGIEAYQSVKFGYLLIYLIYPWLLFFSWRKLVSPLASAAIVVVTLLFAHRQMDWVYYESVTLGLFIPWWLYYMERGLVWAPGTSMLRKRDYILGSLVGGALLMTYYYWFFVALLALPISLAAIFFQTGSLRTGLRELRHKLVMWTGVAIVSAVYWVPLLLSLLRHGSESTQHQWFFLEQADLTNYTPDFNLEVVLTWIGIFSVLYYWRIWGNGKLAWLWLAAVASLLIDRVFNCYELTIQSRKVLDFVHLFAIPPLGIAAITWWRQLSDRRDLRRGLMGIAAVVLLLAVNAHVDERNSEHYRRALAMRFPYDDVEVFRSVDTYHSVFLTQYYNESCYLPYYLFIPLNNMTAHPAGQYSQRAAFLEEVSHVTEPALFAYALAYNKYDRVDYIYLPLDTISRRLKISLYQGDFNRQPVPKSIQFACAISSAPQWFIKYHDRGIYEVIPPSPASDVEQQLHQRYPRIAKHLVTAANNGETLAEVTLTNRFAESQR